MNKDLILVDSLCRRYCSYHKPGKKEDLSCAGFTVIERLARSGRKIDFSLADFVRSRTGDNVLVVHLCSACAFREQDCDFIVDHNLPACGGFVLLAQLLDSGNITIQDVRSTEAP